MSVADHWEHEGPRREMVERQLRRRGIKDQRVLAAMARVPRHRFVLPPDEGEAYADTPLPIGLGQTISQPYMVARMTEILALPASARVLEVGTGSGYQAAVLAEIAAEVYSVERHARLAERARALLAELGFENVEVIVGDGSLGLPEKAPFDGILVTAAAPKVPAPLQEQLAPGGRLVIPVGDSYYQSLAVVERTARGLRRRNVFGCRFVPLVGSEAFPEEDG